MATALSLRIDLDSWYVYCFKSTSLHSIAANINHKHYTDVIMGAMASQITSVSCVYSTICLVLDQRKHERSASLAFVRGIHRWPVKSHHKGPATRKRFPFDDVIIKLCCLCNMFWRYMAMYAKNISSSTVVVRDTWKHISTFLVTTK